MTTERNYDYCQLCRSNHQQGWKHVFSKKHQKTIDFVLRKFSKKVKESKMMLKSPEIERIGFETGSKFWCYFCSCEVEKHRQRDDAVIKFVGFLEHLASAEHRMNLELFWKTHRVPLNDKDKFLISSDQLEKFAKKSEEALASYRARNQLVIAKEAHHILAVESARERILTNHMSKFGQGQLESQPSTSGVNLPKNAAQTKTITQDGLTYIGRVSSSSKQNVYSGGLPPWLQGDTLISTAGTSGGSIGPSMDDLIEYKQQEKKRKLPPERLVANTVSDMSSNNPSQPWLPSFGGVWNKGRRETSKQQFLRRHTKQKTSHFFKTSRP